MNQHANWMAADALDADGFGASYTPPAQQHLVVETRTDDRWRVALCTTLDDLDAALDTARALRADADIDEVCLTLETAGSQGRESRREVIRLGHDGVPDNYRISTKPREQAGAPMPPPSQCADDAALDALLPIIKAPDYTIDEEVLDALEPQPEYRTAYAPERAQATADNEAIAGPMDDAPSEDEARAAARALVNSLYGLSEAEDYRRNALPRPADPEVLDFSEVLPMDRSEAQAAVESADTEQARPDELRQHGTWAHDFEHLPPGGWATAERLEAEDSHLDAAARLERPLIGDPSGVATKTFIVAGTLAMMVLGGALAELMSVDLTASAEAGMAFDRAAAVSLSADER